MVPCICGLGDHDGSCPWRSGLILRTKATADGNEPEFPLRHRRGKGMESVLAKTPDLASTACGTWPVVLRADFQQHGDGH